MDVVKQKQQALVVGNVGPFEGLRRVYAEGGVRKGLMRGYMSGVATYGPFSAIYFLTYERCEFRARVLSVSLSSSVVVGGICREWLRMMRYLLSTSSRI